MSAARVKSSIVCLVLGAMCIVLAGARLRTLREPPEWDIGTYLVIGHELNLGQRLYLDIWDAKPPAIYATFALAERIAGYGQGQIYLLSVAAAMVTLLGVYAAAGTQGREAGLFAAGLWVCVCFEPLTGANLPNTEVFINAALVWAVAILLRMPADRLCLGRTLSVGALLAIASLYKQVAVAPAAMLAIAQVICAQRAMRKTAMAQAAMMAAVGVVTWLAVFGYFASTQRAQLFFDTMFTHPRWYGGNVAANVLESLHPSRIVPAELRPLIPLLCAAMLVLLPRPREHPRRHGMILLLWAIGTHVAVAWPGRFSAHYYQLWFVILAIAGGWGLARLWATLLIPRRWISRCAAVVVFVALLWPQAPWYLLDGDGWARRKYQRTLLNRARDDARSIGAMLLAGETFYAWSDEAWIYYATSRRAPAAGLWKQHTMDGPLGPWLARRTVEQLDRNPPDFFIDWDLLPSPADHPVAQWFRPRYRLLGAGPTRWPFVIYVRIDSPAHQRLMSRADPTSQNSAAAQDGVRQQSLAGMLGRQQLDQTGE